MNEIQGGFLMYFKSPKIRLICLSLIILSILFVGCHRKEEPPVEIIKVRVNEVIRSPLYAPFYVALDQGFFKEEGLDIELATSWDGGITRDGLLEGQWEIGLLGIDTSIQVYQQNQDIRLINFAQLTQRDGSFLVAREPAPVFKWKDLQRKIIIGGRKGSTPQVILEYLLKNNNLNPQKDVEIIHNLDINSTRGAFIGGVGHYVQLLEPALSLLEKGEIGQTMIYLGQHAGILAHTSFMATNQFIKENPKHIQGFTNAIYKGQIWCANHTVEEISQRIKDYFPDYDSTIIAKGVKRYKEYGAWSPNPLIKSEGLEKLQNIMMKVGELVKEIPYETLVDKSFAEKAIEDIPLPEIKE